jgi:uncharacterized protein (DUF2236 family)
MPRTFRTTITRAKWVPSPKYWQEFQHHCLKKMLDNVNSDSASEQTLLDIMNIELQPYGTVVKTRQSMYVLWDDKKCYTMFLMKWS